MSFSVKHRELLPQGTDMEFSRLLSFLRAFLLTEHNEDGSHIIAAGTTLDMTHPWVTIGNTSGLTNERALVGTANQVTVTDNGAGSTVALGLPQDINIGATPTWAGLTLSGLPSGRIVYTSTGGLLVTSSSFTFDGVTLTLPPISSSTISATTGTITTVNSTTGNFTTITATTGNIVTVNSTTVNATTAATTTTTATSVVTTTASIGAAAGSATSLHKVVKKVTGIADNTATNVITVTVPNGNHAAAIRLLFVSSNGSTDAFESSRCAAGTIVLARTTGNNVVATASTIDHTAIATVAAGATHTLSYDLSSISGTTGATNSFSIRVTIDDSGNLGSNQVVVFAEVLNSESSGVTIA